MKVQVNDAAKSECPAVMAVDRGSNFALPERGADFLQVWQDDNNGVNFNGGSVYNGCYDFVVQASSGPISFG